MKYLLSLALVLALLFSGCVANVAPDQTESSVPETTAAPGLYLPESAVEKQTQGAVYRYDLPEEYQTITGIGDKLLLVTQDDKLTLTELVGERRSLGQTVELPLSPAWRAVHSGFVYYDTQTGEIVFLDAQLQKMKSIALPEQMQGNPVISEDGGYVFYCTQGQIHALETEYKISRLIKSHSGVEQTLRGSFFNGELLGCSIQSADGSVSTEYISTQNGQTVATDNTISQLFTNENSFVAFRQDGSILQTLVGTKEAAAQQLLTEAQVFPAMELGGAIACTAVESGVTLDFHTIPDGKRTASVTLDGFSAPIAVYADKWNKCVWILTTDASAQEQVLLRWNVQSSAIDDETVYISDLYTADSPDEEGLEACKDRVKQMNDDHDVLIRIWQTALKDTNGYDFVPEHQVGAIEKTLDDIEQVLDLFPSRFLSKASVKRIRIFVVRSINSEVTSTFYWENSDPTIVLCAGTDVSLGLVKGLGYVIDSNILGESSAYDDWDSLNPEGFVYGDSETYSADYLSGESKAFLSESAMESAREDRSQIFYNAIKADNADAFASGVMQDKLLQLCKGIRSAWSLKKKTDTFPWEQYLSESIAYEG